MTFIINLVIPHRHNEIQEIFSSAIQEQDANNLHVLPQNTATGNKIAVDYCTQSQLIFWDTYLCLYAAIHYIPLILSTKPSSFLLFSLYSSANCIQLQINSKTLSPTTALITHAHGPEMTSLLLGQPVAKKQTCACLITKQEPDRVIIKQ